MAPVNAIAKVRFSSARPQRVHLLDQPSGKADLLCMESGQSLSVSAPVGALYVITGSARVTDTRGTAELPTGHLVAPEGDCTVANAGQGRLVCLCFSSGG